jgi:DNA invertase Pin-like site-specific DNA recombinase
VLIINTLDRASRDLIAGRKLIAAAHDEGWRVIGLDGIDSADDGQAFMNNMRLLFAEEERKKISDRTQGRFATCKTGGRAIRET